MRVIHLISGGDVGGAKTHVLSLLQGLGQRHTVLLACFVEGPFAQEARDLGIETLVFPSKNIWSVCRELEQVILKERIELIHCHGARGNLIGVLLKRRVGLAVLTTVHSDPWKDYMGRPLSNLVYGSANRWALRRTDFQIGVSSSTRELLIRRGFDPQRIFEIYNGVDFERIPVPEDRASFFRRIGLQTEQNSVVFGIAARISPVKDMPTLIRGFAGAVREEPHARLVIAGDGEGRKELERLAASLCPPGTVVFAGWISDVDSFYNAIDVNTLSSVTEAFPYALPEGARHHCATIATRVGGVPKIILPEKTGILLEPGDTDAMTEAMLRLIRDGTLRRRLADTLYEYARENFSVEATVRCQENIYISAASKMRRWLRERDGVLICGAYGRGNAGDDIILDAIVRQLRSFDPDLPISVMTKAPAFTALQVNVRPVYTFRTGQVRREMRRAKLFISGGGSLIQDATSTRSLLFYLWSIRTARRLGCRVMMYGCGIGPVRGRWNRSLTGKILNRSVDLVTLRDPDSAQELRSLGVLQPEIQVTADPALLQEVRREGLEEFWQAAGLEKGRQYAMFVLRPWNAVHKKLHAIAAAAEYVSRSYGMTPAFFCMSPEKDGEITRQLAALVQAPGVFLPAQEDGAKICALMSRMSLVVSMRLHALIFASGQGIPVVGISYDPKVRSYLDYLGQENSVSLDELKESILCDQIDSALSAAASEPEMVNRLQALAQRNGQMAWELLEE